MKRLGILISLLISLTLAGCGGATGSFFTQISGAITDLNANPVRSARVWCNGGETVSNSGGAYVLSGVGSGNRVIHAEIWQNGVHFTGHNMVRVFPNERSKSVNITVVRVSQQAAIHGTVRDRDGFRVAGARVFANIGTLSSTVAISNDQGDYEMSELAAGLNYGVTASGRTWDSDTVSINLSAGENRRIDFILSDPANPALPAPQNVSAVAWTTPFEGTRAPRDQSAFEGIKRMIDPKYARAHRTTRLSTNGNHVEVDVYWDPLPGQYFDSLLGFGVYRATTAGGASVAVDLLRDPYALFYSDIDDALHANTPYYYEITALNTEFPDTGNSESAFSNRYGVFTLDDMRIQTVTQGPLTFHWLPVANADNYMVFLFDEFPGIDVTAFWDNSGSPTTNTFLVYSGPQLVPGKRYYYVVLGTANSMDSRTLSVIGDFIAN